MSFSSATPGNWLVVFVSSGVPIGSTTSGYQQHEYVGSGFSLRMFIKEATGGESSFTVSTSQSTIKCHVSMVEVYGPMELSGTLARTSSGGSAFTDTLPRAGGVMVAGAALLSVGSFSTVSWPSQVDSQWSMETAATDGGSVPNWHISSVAYETGLSTSYSFPGASVSGTYGFAAAVFYPPEPPDDDPPSVPSNLRLTGMTPTSVTVAWDASSDNMGVSGYTTYLNGVERGSTSSQSATFSGLTPGVSVTVQVDAYDYKGNRSEKAELVVTPVNDTTPPLTPVVKVTGLAAGKITIGWDTPYDQSAVVAYGVYLNGQKQGGDQTGRTRTFSNLTAGALYTVSVDALDLLGNRSAKGTRTVRAQADTTPPTVPGNVSVVATSKTAITLAWTPSTDDNVGVTGYGLYLGAFRIAEVPSRVYTFTGLTPGVTYTVGVDAVDELGNRSSRVMLQATTLADLSGAAPPYEYVLYDWDSHLPLDSLPLQNVSFEITLGGGGTLSADIPLYDDAYTIGRVAAATRPERTMIMVYRGEQLVWGGRIIDPADYDSETGVLKITAEESIAIYGKRYVAFTGPRNGTVADTEVTWLLEHAARPADLRWLTYDGAAGSGTPVDREYRSEDFERILDKATEVAAAPGGFDWWVAPGWDAVNDRPRFVLRRISRETPPDTGLTLEYPGNVRRYKRSTRRGLATRTWGQLRRPDGGVMLSSVTRTDLLADGWPLIEEAWQFDGLTSQAALDAETKRASDASAGAKQLFEFDLAITPDVRWWQWELGGTARVVITDHLFPAQPDGSPGLDRSMKIVSLKVQPDSAEGELVTVTTGEHTVAVD
ncbi:fibronectin type III domain-containing protein [Planomonospora sp. ID82291]|uniref:fibronectin type III domain-containing protein n=1 Tax=Planomonospora sp. ID82291 TaxID=2738136 RepID=UPI0018C3DD22|nr:fibronectin type III domain-containing protein [Planomonospora sp. ID82291]MBG0819019.1 fibronectin type III domain-containing protein [Planomonospora sp. ID82291]